MFGSAKTGANAYARVGLETGVVAASPHKLIVMLFDGALIALSNAQMYMSSGNIAEKGLSLSKAIDIIQNGLRASLDRTAGGEIASNLDALYDYMIRRLFDANLKNSIVALQEVHKLLSELKEAWEAIDPAKSVVDVAPAQKKISAPAATYNLAKA